MTNTKFRKRALLSSIAMLLVALVALGSATFAWFVANPTATASGLSIETKAAPGIAIASETLLPRKAASESYGDAYKGTTPLNVPTTATSYASAASDAADIQLQPASPNTTLATNSNAISFGRIDANAAGNYIGDDEGKFVAATGNKTYYYNEKIYLRTSTTDSGATATVNSAMVKITPNSGTSNNIKYAVRVALTSSKNELIGIWKPADATATKTWNGNTTDAYGAAGADVLSASAYSYTNSETYKAIPTPIELGPSMESDGTTTNYINVYVYLDGEDQYVYSNNVPSVTDLVSAIEINVSSNAAS